MLTEEDNFVTTVSSYKDLGKTTAKILKTDKKALFLPTELTAIHLEHTEYFFDHKTSIASKCRKFLFLDTLRQSVCSHKNVLKAYNCKLSILTCCTVHFVFFVELIKF